MLTDAIYLQAWWASPFEPGQTSTGRFTSAGGQSGPAHFLTGGGYASVTSRGWTGVSLPYQGGRLSMTAVLPPAGDGADGCPDLTARALAGLAKPLSAGHGTQGTAVVLPEINLRAQETLNGLLSKLGMAVAFTSAADFTGMSPVAGSIGEVEHAATLRVDARGTVASAATAVTILPSAGRQGRADRRVQPAVFAAGVGRQHGRAALPGPGRQPGPALTGPRAPVV